VERPSATAAIDRPSPITELKRQVAQEFIAGETLHGLAARHGVSRHLIQQADNQQTLTLRDFELYCSASSGNCGTAINANLWVPTGFHVTDNVEIRPLAGHNWANGINAVNASRLEINRASISGTFAPTRAFHS
jgi:hypothetical protein